MPRICLALAFLLASFLGRAQAPLPPPGAAFHSLISIVQRPDVAQWYALHPANPEPVYRAGLRHGGSVADLIAESPQDTARVASLYRQYLLGQLLDNLWSAFGNSLNLQGLSLTDVVWGAPKSRRYIEDTACYIYKGHGLLRSGSGHAVYVVGGVFIVAPDGQVLRASIDGIVPGSGMAAYTRWEDSMSNRPIDNPVAGPTPEEMAALGKEVTLTFRGTCGNDSILLTERYLRHPGGVQYLQTTSYEVKGSAHPLVQPGGRYLTRLGYYGYQLEDLDANRHWCLLRKGDTIMGFVVSGNYLPVCNVQLREMVQ